MMVVQIVMFTHCNADNGKLQVMDKGNVRVAGKWTSNSAICQMTAFANYVMNVCYQNVYPASLGQVSSQNNYKTGGYMYISSSYVT
jgi:hypothetical protein